MAEQTTFPQMIRRYFLAGVLVVVPLILTYLVLRFLFDVIDGILQPLIVQLVGKPLPGLGIVATIALVFLMGVLTRNIVGSYLLEVWEKMIVNVPLIKPIYSASKQLLEAITLPSAKSFSDVVLIEYPRNGTFALGFVTNHLEASGVNRLHKLVAVFVPSTPTPMSGFVILTPATEVQVITNMTVQEGVNYLVSGGVVSPERFELASLSDRPVEKVVHEAR